MSRVDLSAARPTGKPWRCPGCGVELHDPKTVQDHIRRCEKFKSYLEELRLTRRDGLK